MQAAPVRTELAWRVATTTMSGMVGVTMPPNKRMREGGNDGGVTMPPADRNVGGVTMPPTDRNVGGVTMPPANRNVGGVTMPPASRTAAAAAAAAAKNDGADAAAGAAAAPVGVAMPPKWHLFARMQAKGKADKLAREEDKDVHPDDAVILRKIDDPVERMKVARRLRKRRKKMYRDRDFGGASMSRGRSTKLLSQGRHTTRTDLSANNTLTQLEAAKTRVLPGAAIPAEVAQQLELERAREEAAQTALEMASAGISAEDGGPAAAFNFKVGDIDPATGKELDINDIELMKIRAEQERLKPLLQKEERHKLTGGRQYESFADKRDDPDRLTWDEFKKLHSKDMDFGQVKEMGEYRARLDEERERKLKASRLARKLSKKEQKEKRKQLIAKKKRKAAAAAAGGGGGGGSDEDSDEGDVGVGGLSSFLQDSDDSD